MKYLNNLLFILITLACLSLPNLVSAQTYDRCPPNNEYRYCQGGKAYVKTGCTVDPAKVARCNTDAAAMGQDETSYCDLTKNSFCYNCAYVQVGETCDNGGVPNEPTGVEGVFGKIQLPAQIRQIGEGSQGINNLIKVGVDLLFLVGAISCVFFVLWGSIEYMSAGTRKEGAAEARKKISYALIGLVLLGLSFVIIRLVGSIVGLEQYFNF